MLITDTRIKSGRTSLLMFFFFYLNFSEHVGRKVSKSTHMMWTQVDYHDIITM